MFPSTPELAYLIGVFFGDGYVSKYQRNVHTRIKGWHKNYNYEVGLGATDLEFVTKFSQSLTHVLGRNKLYAINKIFPYGRLVFRCHTTSKKLYHFIKDKRIERFYDYIAPFPNEFLAGVFDSEGSIVYLKKKRYQITLSNTNLDLLNVIKNILKSKLDITSHINFHLPAGHISYDKESQKKIIRRKDGYVLYIYGTEWTKFRENIKFTIKRKQEILNQAIIDRNRIEEKSARIMPTIKW